MSIDFLEDFISDRKLLSDFMDECFYKKDVNVRNPMEIPWRWSPSTTTDKFPQFAHVMLQRSSEKPISPFYEFFHMIMDKFMRDHDIKYKKVIRSCLNCTYHIPNYNLFDPHVDSHIKHYNVILYLNSCEGNTIIFDKKLDFSAKFNDGVIPARFDGIIPYEEVDWNNDPMPIKYEIKPEMGKMIVFDGSYYHSLRPTEPGNLRLINVQNISY